MAERTRERRTWLTRERVALAGLLAFTLVVRGGVLFAMRGKLADDPDAYRRIAENLLTDGVFSMDEREPYQPNSDVRTPNPEKAPWKTPTAYRPPLYSVVLSNLAAGDRAHVSLGKVAALHLLLGLGTVWLTWSLARRLQIANCELQIANWGDGGPAPAERASPILRDLAMPLVAGVLVACDPILLNQSALVMTETLATFLAVLGLWCLTRFDEQPSWFNAGLAGGAMGLAVLCRPTFLPWLGLVAVGMLVARARMERRREGEKERGRWSDLGWRVPNCAALVGVAAIVVSPWVIRNQRVFGKPIVTTTHGGYTLWLGNNVDFYDWLRTDKSSLPWDVKRKRAQQQIVDEAMLRVNVVMEMRDSRFFERWPSEELGTDHLHSSVALRTIEQDPMGFFRACLYRLSQLWSPVPNRLTAEESTGRRLLRYAVAGWYCGVYLLAAVGIWRLCSARVSDPAETADRRSPGSVEEGDLRSGACAGSGDQRTTRAGTWRLRWQLFRPPWVWGVLLCVVFTGVHTFYWSNLRMRAPLMPFVALVAAASLWPGRK